MTEAKIEARHFLVCPKCGSQISSVDHLKKVGSTFGPWSCRNDDCDADVRGVVTASGIQVEVTSHERRGRLYLLKLRDVYFVMRNRYVSAEPGDHDDYFIHSHQCPTNLIRDAIAAFDADGNDPHGIFRLVASVPFSHDSEDQIRGMVGLSEILAFFRTDGTPLETDWPEEDKGVLNFIAQAQREETARRAPKA